MAFQRWALPRRILTGKHDPARQTSPWRMHLPQTWLPTPWDLTSSLRSTHLLDSSVGGDSVTFDGIHWSVDKGKGHVLDAGAG